MMLTKELIKVLIKDQVHLLPDELAEHLHNEILRVKSLSLAIADAKESKHLAREEYELKCKKADEEIKNVQQWCKHETTSFNPDPAGGRDSWSDCDICGKVI